ncbi:hypothetical protein JCM15519_24330 [Fundidesulfovibrio butyratiphilus]
MKIFLSALSIPIIKDLNRINPAWKPNVLLTFYGLVEHMSYLSVYRHMIGDVILDCGTHSLYELYRQRYERERAAKRLFNRFKYFAKVMQSKFDFIFSFDEKYEPDSFEHNWELQVELENEGINVVPVLHNLSNNDADRLIAGGYKMVAIGQCHGENRDDLAVLSPVVNKLYSAGIKVHLFGMTSPKLIGYVPAYSCDSKTWLDYGKRGRVLYWNPVNPGLDKADLLYFPKHQNPSTTSSGVYYHDYPHLEAFEEQIKNKLCIGRRDLLGLRHAHYCQLVNALYFLELEEMITRRHLDEDIKFD